MDKNIRSRATSSLRLRGLRSRRATLITKHTSVTFRLSMIYLKPNPTRPVRPRVGASIVFSSDAIARRAHLCCGCMYVWWNASARKRHISVIRLQPGSKVSPDGMRAILSHFTRGAHLPKFRERGLPGEPNYHVELSHHVKQRSSPHKRPACVNSSLAYVAILIFVLAYC